MESLQIFFCIGGGYHAAITNTVPNYKCCAVPVYSQGLKKQQTQEICPAIVLKDISDDDIFGKF